MYSIENFKNIHKGDRVFIIGTGPSLNKTNLDLLDGEITFGVNTLFKINSFCNYYGVSDCGTFIRHYRGILSLPKSTVFITGGAANWFNVATCDGSLNIDRLLRHVTRFDRLVNEPITLDRIEGTFSKDISRGVCWGATVIYDICLQCAYYMGFSKVYLLGCDCDYSAGHHFDDEISPNSPDRRKREKGNWADIFESYKVAKEIFESDGREIINCTVGGKLEVFKREPLEEVLSGR
jgi:hypothetical protein